ncbi:MAG: hypothetical protein M3O70_17090 [Actinomycetota bacterium]|nr:hypothetical protein [Actinomycetota bacterium]
MRISVIRGLARAAAVSATAIVLTLGSVAAGAGAEPGDNGNGANASASAQGKPSDTGKPDEKGAPRSDRGQAQSSQGKPSSEDTNSPQPPSNADYSGNGANTHGPYDSTRDGSPSQNGEGDGKAKGKPCAGCVGKADNKNPPGQMPGGSDPNAGYECDTNKGVGKSNPAHTSCKEQPTTPPETTPPGKTPPPETTPPESTPPTTTTAPPPTTDTTPPETTTQPAPTAPGTQPPAGGPAPEAAPETLPTTGVNAMLPLLGGLAAVLIGGVLLLIGRRWASARQR